MQDRAASAATGVLLMVVIAVMASAGTYLVAENAIKFPPQSQFTVVRLDTDAQAGTIHARIYAGEPIKVESGYIIVRMDGTEKRHELREFPEIQGDLWTSSEPVCIVGPDCKYTAGSRVEVTVVADGTVMGHTSAYVQAFKVNPDGGIQVNCAGDVFVDIVGVQITYGQNGPDIPVFVDYTDNHGSTIEPLFGGNAVFGGLLAHRHADAGDILGVRGTADNGQFFSQWVSYDTDPHVRVLVDGDIPPDFKPYGNQTGVEVFMEPHLDQAGLIDLDPNQVIILYEFTSNLNSAAADFQDLVVLFTFPTASCEV